MTGLSLGNVASESYDYDANRMQLITQTATKSGGPANGLMNLAYGYDALAGQVGAGSTPGNAGQLMSISGTIVGLTESAAYSYDNLGRLLTSNQSSNGSSAQRRFAYDRWGNRTGMWNAVSGGSQIQSIALQQSGGVPTNRITSVTSGSTVNYTYDAAGNVTNDGVHSYGYDSENRLVGVDGGSTASYAYDNQNRRYKKTVGATVTHYVWQGSQVIAEHNGSTGAVLIDYVYSGRRMVARVSSGTTQYFLSDRLSARLVLDASGNVIGRMAHLPFGEDFGESGAQEKHHFTSYERDSESGTDDAVNRKYSSGTGRFLRPDPLSESAKTELPRTWNRYAYSLNDPVNMNDPWGLEPFYCPSCVAPPPLPWERNPCRPFGASFLVDGFETFSSMMCGGPLRSQANLLDAIGDIIDALLPGRLKVQSSCQNVVYLPEDSVGKPWGAPQNNVWQDCDAVATPRGIVKIPNGCDCTVKCDGGADYRINCTCSVLSALGLIGINDPHSVPPGPAGGFNDPRDEGYFWVATGNPYSRSGGWPCDTCGTTEWAFD